MTIKPVLYGGIAAPRRVPGMVAAISGLGFVFLSNSLKMRLVRAWWRAFTGSRWGMATAG